MAEYAEPVLTYLEQLFLRTKEKIRGKHVVGLVCINIGLAYISYVRAEWSRVGE